MKTTIALLLLAVVHIARAQISTNKTNGVSVARSLYLSGRTNLYLSSRTNLVQVPQAIRVASHLHPGMSEADATKFLQQHGIGSCVIVTDGTTNVYSLSGTSNVYTLSIGSSLGWTTFYELAEGCSLGLEMRPSQIRTDRIWGGNGLLKGAIIQSNGINIVTVTLTNNP
jgi:hypothetical protein